jgi:hypothetical protein
MLASIKIPGNGDVTVNVPDSTIGYVFKDDILILACKPFEVPVQEFVKEVHGLHPNLILIERDCLRAEKWGYPEAATPKLNFREFRLVKRSAVQGRDLEYIRIAEGMSGVVAVPALGSPLMGG